MIYVILAYLTYPVIFFFSKFIKRDGDAIVIMQTAKIGDMICTTPVFREIKRARPSSRLGVVADSVTIPLIKCNPHVDEIIEYDGSRHKGLIGKINLAREIYGQRYSAVVILMPNMTNILSAFWAMIPKRAAVYPNYGGTTLKLIMGLNTDIEAHTSSRMSLETYLASLRCLGIEAGSSEKEVYSSSDADRMAETALMGTLPFIGIVLGTGNSLKDWGRENFLGIVEGLFDQISWTFVLLGSLNEYEVGDYIVKRIGDHDRILNLCGRFSLAEMPAVIGRLALVIGVDTGLIYMADALGIPVIDIAGPCNMNDQRPTGRSSVIIQNSEIDCVPCSHTFSTPYSCKMGHRSCVTSITVKDVLPKISSLLSQT